MAGACFKCEEGGELRYPSVTATIHVEKGVSHVGGGKYVETRNRLFRARMEAARMLAAKSPADVLGVRLMHRRKEREMHTAYASLL